MTTTLLIWELVPDELQFFAIPGISDEDVEHLKKINGKLGNGDDLTDEAWASHNKISESLSAEFYPTEEQPECPEHQGRWANFKIDAGELNDYKYEAVYQSGWLL